MAKNKNDDLELLPDLPENIFVISEETIRERTYIIRNQKVMLDFDLAEIYGYETKNLNRQVKNNIKKILRRRLYV